MMGPLWVPRSVWLVIRREYASRVRSRGVLLVTGCVALAVVAFLLVQALVVERSAPVRVGLAGQAISLEQVLPQEMGALGVTVTVLPVDSVDAGTEQVRAGQLDALVYGARSALRVTVDNQLDPRLRATLNGQVRQQILDAQIAQLGARPDDVLAKVDQAQVSVTQLNATDPNIGQRRAVGVVTGLLLAWALLTFTLLAARRVAEDAESGTGEALLTVLRPRRLLAGNLGGVGLAGLAHLTLVGGLATILSIALGVATVPSAVLLALVGGLVWFVLGFGLYGTLATVATAVADRPVARRRVPLALGGWIVLLVVLSAVLLDSAPGAPVTAVLSVLPPFAPVLLAGRMAAGVAPAWQVLLAVVLALGSIGGLSWFAGRVYPRSLLKA